MNLARRSSRATWRMTSGFRYFSAVPAKGASSSEIKRNGVRGALFVAEVGPVEAMPVQLGRRRQFDSCVHARSYLGGSGSRISAEQPLDQAFGRLTLGLGLEVRADAVPQDRDRPPCGCRRARR